MISLDTAGRLTVGSKMIVLTSVGRLGDLGASPDTLNGPFVTAIGGQAVSAALAAVAVGDMTMTRGAPGKTIGGTLVSLNPAGQLVVGSKTVTLGGTAGSASAGSGESDDQFGDSSPILTTLIGGAPVTVASTAVAFAGTILTPGAPGRTIDGTLVSMNPAGQLVIGSKTISSQTISSLETSSAGLGRLIMGGFGAGGPLNSPSTPIGKGWSNGTTGNDSTYARGGAVVFQGGAEGRPKSHLLFYKTGAAALPAIAILVSLQVGVRWY